MPIVVIGLSHHTSPVTVRERFAFAETKIPEALQRLRDSVHANEEVILSTCNRVEIYEATNQEARKATAALRQLLLDCPDSREPLTREIYSLAEPHSVEHLFRV